MCRQIDFRDLKGVQIPLSAHPCRAQKILNDEDRHFVIRGYHKWPRYAGFDINQVVSALSIKGETFLFKNRHQLHAMDGPKGGHQRTLAVSRSSATNSGATQESPCLL
jgi:hypothetical protein